MANLFSNLAGFTFPNTVMNQGPLPPPTGGKNTEFQNPDGMINESNALLDNVNPYAYGPNKARPSTQTSYVNHPHMVQKVMPKIFIPAAKADHNLPDIPLEHSLYDGDLTFTLRMPREMIVGPSEFCHARNVPGRSLAQLVNLATINYLLWGLQIGRRSPNARNNRWQDFYLRLTEGQLHYLKDVDTEEGVWNFVQMYLRPFGVMVGSDKQGGQHEGGNNRIATYPVDFVASFLIDGKCRKLNNLWRHSNISAGDDVGLVLKKTTENEKSIMHVLTTGGRSYRDERTDSDRSWYYLAPAIIGPETHKQPFIHIGRSQGQYSAYNVGMGMGRCPWDARACTLGVGIQVTFCPTFYTPDHVKYRKGTGSIVVRNLVTSKTGGAAAPASAFDTNIVPTGSTGAEASRVEGIAGASLATSSSLTATGSDVGGRNQKSKKIKKIGVTFSLPGGGDDISTTSEVSGE